MWPRWPSRDTARLPRFAAPAPAASPRRTGRAAHDARTVVGNRQAWWSFRSRCAPAARWPMPPGRRTACAVPVAMPAHSLRRSSSRRARPPTGCASRGTGGRRGGNVGAPGAAGVTEMLVKRRLRRGRWIVEQQQVRRSVALPMVDIRTGPRHPPPRLRASRAASPARTA